jgi:hypothetical protein
MIKNNPPLATSQVEWVDRVARMAGHKLTGAEVVGPSIVISFNGRPSLVVRGDKQDHSYTVINFEPGNVIEGAYVSRCIRTSPSGVFPVVSMYEARINLAGYGYVSVIVKRETPGDPRDGFRFLCERVKKKNLVDLSDKPLIKV